MYIYMAWCMFFKSGISEYSPQLLLEQLIWAEVTPPYKPLSLLLTSR